MSHELFRFRMTFCSTLFRVPSLVLGLSKCSWWLWLFWTYELLRFNIVKIWQDIQHRQKKDGKYSLHFQKVITDHHPEHEVQWQLSSWWVRLSVKMLPSREDNHTRVPEESGTAGPGPPTSQPPRHKIGECHDVRCQCPHSAPAPGAPGARCNVGNFTVTKDISGHSRCM